MQPLNHVLVMRLAPATQELLGVVIVGVAQAGQALGDEGSDQWLCAVDLDAVAPGGVAVGKGGRHWAGSGRRGNEREDAGEQARACFCALSVTL
ncbi:hypothetical protein NEH50_18890 [Xanthomonas hortorum pv. pelargonii]|nr:hypothetical protein [Xanthomonas hortorum]MCM5576090.1 hypothetical protein [Xanthomonas hortorum pv. pelargonii]